MGLLDFQEWINYQMLYFQMKKGKLSVFSGFWEWTDQLCVGLQVARSQLWGERRAKDGSFLDINDGKRGAKDKNWRGEGGGGGEEVDGVQAVSRLPPHHNHCPCMHMVVIMSPTPNQILFLFSSHPGQVSTSHPDPRQLPSLAHLPPLPLRLQARHGGWGWDQPRGGRRSRQTGIGGKENTFAKVDSFELKISEHLPCEPTSWWDDPPTSWTKIFQLFKGWR